MPALLEEAPLTKIVGVRLDTETHKKLLAVAKKQGLGQTLRIAVREYLSKKPEAPTETRSHRYSLVSDNHTSLEAQKKNSVAVC